MLKSVLTKKMKARYLIYFILAGLFLGCFTGAFVHDVSAASATYSTGFEDGVALSQYNTTYFKSYKYSGYQFYVSAEQKEAGSLGFAVKVGTGAMNGNWNFSFPDYIQSISFSKYCNNGNIGEMWMGFYNDTNVLLGQMRFVGGSGHQVQYVDDTGTHTLGTASSSWTTTSVSFASNGLITYMNGATSATANPIAVDLVHGVKYIKFYSSSSAFNYYYFDTIMVTYGNFSSGVNESTFCGYYDMSPYTMATPLSYTLIAPYRYATTYKYLENRYNTPLSTTIQGVALIVSYEHSATSISEYGLKVNGVNIGMPNCIVEYGSPGVYAVFWDCSVGLTDEQPLFEFYHSMKLPGLDYYWRFYQDETHTPGGWSGTIAHSSSSLYNGNYDGSYIPALSQMFFWYGEVTFTNASSPYDDLVTVPKSSYYTYDTVPVHYFISDFTYSNVLQLWHNGTQMTAFGFPMNISVGDFDGETLFIPLSIGKYQVRLVRNSVKVTSVNITVTNPADMNYILYVYPNPHQGDEEFTIGYRFYPSDGEDGFVSLSTKANSTSFDDFRQKWNIEANTSGNFSFLESYLLYASLYKHQGSSYLLKKIVLVKVSSLSEENSISVQYPIFSLSSSVPSFYQRIKGTHVSSGFSFVVKMNNKIVRDVSEEGLFDFSVLVSSAGLYRVDLCLESLNGSIVVASVNFSVSSSSGPGGEQGETFGPEMKALFGICCVIVSVCVPLIISVKYHVNVPTFVYVIFMSFGIALGVKMGFLDLWLVFLFVVALVAGAVYTIFGHGGPGPGTGSGGDRTIRERVFTRRGSDEGVRRNGR